MKKYILLTGVLALLAGCQTKEVSHQKETKTPASSQTSTSSSATAQEENKAKTGVVPDYNGSYYSVKGKYGEVLIVNKKYPLSSDYNPGENPEAKAAFNQLLAAMKEQGFAVSDQYSGFRSYETQSGLYQAYVASDGQVEADRYSARPGHSEHQSGLAFDFIDTGGNLLEDPVAADWLAKHAHEYGFVVRYLAGKEAVTGYMAETWHIRYIGKEATDIYNAGLTLEEYFGVEGGDYAE